MTTKVAVKANLNTGLFQHLSDMIAAGFIRPAGSHRQHSHSRMYTKRYADGRQKQGRGLYALKESQITIRRRPAPKPSEKAVARLRASQSRRSGLARRLGQLVRLP